MDKRHYLVTSRIVDLVKGDPNRNIPDQYWYRSDSNDSAEFAQPFMRCGRYVVSNGNVDAPFFYNPGNEDADYVLSGNAMNEEQIKAKDGSKEMLTLLFDELDAEKKDLLIFNFGYENREQKEFGHLEFVHKNYVTKESNIGRVLMVTWPSQGFGEYDQELGKPGILGRLLGLKPKRYVRKGSEIESDVTITGKALAVFFMKLDTFMKDRYGSGPSPKVHLIVQSMANRILENVAINLKKYGKQGVLNGRFSRLMLTSPDVPDNLFEVSPAYSDAAAFAEKTYVVCSEQDWILQMADKFHGIPGTMRMGRRGPKDMSKVPANVFTLKVQQHQVKITPPDFNHRYFEYNPEVIKSYTSIFNAQSSGNSDIMA